MDPDDLQHVQECGLPLPSCARCSYLHARFELQVTWLRRKGDKYGCVFCARERLTTLWGRNEVTTAKTMKTS